MFKLIESFKETTAQTKLYIFCIVLFGMIILGGFFYAFLRLDYVRSYPTKAHAVKADSKK